METSTPEAENVDAAVLEAFHREIASRNTATSTGCWSSAHCIVFESLPTTTVSSRAKENAALQATDPDWHPYYHGNVPYHASQ
jgi:hypothetical protein